MKKAAIIIGRVSGGLIAGCALLFLIAGISFLSLSTLDVYSDINYVYISFGIVYIVLSIFFVLCSIISFIASNKISGAKTKHDAIGWGVALLICSIPVAGVLVFCSRQSEYSGYIKEINNKEVNSSNDEIKNLELLKKYKELLDKGAITQEEYDEKKKKLF